ncbi:pseudoazurin [Tamilnaduibacter salinus]|nr:pseudoazurin [Tamilnaduibacter salinus]
MKANRTHLALVTAMSLLAGNAVAAEHVIEMKNSGPDGAMVFEPGYVEAEKGDTIRFVPVDPAHNSVSVAVPEGASSWSGGMNEEVTITVDQEGVYVYKCTPHQALNMAGVISVGDATNYEAAQNAVKTLTSNAATNKDRLTGYFSNVSAD